MGEQYFGNVWPLALRLLALRLSSLLLNNGNNLLEGSILAGNNFVPDLYSQIVLNGNLDFSLPDGSFRLSNLLNLQNDTQLLSNNQQVNTNNQLLNTVTRDINDQIFTQTYFQTGDIETARNAAHPYSYLSLNLLPGSAPEVKYPLDPYSYLSLNLLPGSAPEVKYPLQDPRFQAYLAAQDAAKLKDYYDPNEIKSDPFMEAGSAVLNTAGLAIGGLAGKVISSVGKNAGTVKNSILALNAIRKAEKAGQTGLGTAKTGNAMAIAGAAADIAGSFMPEKTEYSGEQGNLTQTLDTAYDGISDAAMAMGPIGMIVGGAMKGGSLLGKGLNALGGGTDAMTTTDAILGSSFLNLTPFGIINGFGGSTTRDLKKDTDAFALVGSSYTGTNQAVDNALSKAGKKYGLFSRGAYEKAQDLIMEADRQLLLLSQIADESRDAFAIRESMAATNSLRRAFERSGGYNQSSIRVGKHGFSINPLSTLAACEPENIVENTILMALDPEEDILEFKVGGILLPLDPEIIIETLISVDPEEDILEFKAGGSIKETPKRKYTKPTYEEWVKTVPKNRLSDFYDLETAYNTLPFYELESWRTATNKELQRGDKHLPSCVEIEDGIIMFLKKGQEDPNKPNYNPEVHFELDQWFDPNEHGWYDYGRLHYDLIYKDDRYWYVPKELSEEFINKFQEGGKFNVIPEGALHARLHHMENADNLTKKGIPVVVEKEDGELELQAEIECNEIIYRLSVTKEIERLSKIYYDNNSTKQEKDNAAIEAGKLLTKETLFNTVDNTGLINTI